MREERIARTLGLQERLRDEGLDAAVITDPDTIYYLTGYANYLGVEFGRPTCFVVPRAGGCSIVTPLMEAEMCRRMAWVDGIRPWQDGVDGEWRGALAPLIRGARRLGVESDRLPPEVASHLRGNGEADALVDIAPAVGAMRMIKSAAEVAIMRQAGEVAVAMADAARATIADGVPEYEVALAVIAAGTRKAAGLIAAQGDDRFVSPTIYNLQIMQSGADTAMVHRRSSTRRLCRGDPVYLCFCGIANFRHYKLGFDRELFVGAATDEAARAYETAVAAQEAALAAIRPGAPAEEVHLAAEAVYRAAGVAPGYRTGRGIGCSFLERPELKRGDRTHLAPGMTFAVDGGVTLPGRLGARVGDSIVVTADGFEYLTPYPKALAAL